MTARAPWVRSMMPVVAGAILAGGFLAPLRAGAAVDLTGRWFIQADTYFGQFTYMEDWVQTGTALAVTNVGQAAPWAAGTIDPDTGEFQLVETDPPIPFCPLGGMDGTAAPDGKAFSADAITYLTMRCMGFPSQISGSRCGNQQIDPGEQCDDGNASSGDCCSSTCQFEGLRASCSDGNECTDDACDGAGACLPANREDGSPCGSTCMAGSCAAGSCALGPPAAAGTRCAADDTSCTKDTCDGAGECVAAVRTNCRQASGKTSILLRGAAARGGKKLVWKWRDDTGSTTTAAFGNPLATTDYTVCAFAGTALAPLAEASMPAGGTCGTRPCWSGNPDGFAYSDPERTPEGIRSLRLKARAAGLATIAARGGGDYLADFLYLGIPSLSVQLVAIDDTDETCWVAEYTSPSVNDGLTYKATH